MTNSHSALDAVEWIGDRDGHLRLLDQTRLPHVQEFLDCRTVDQVWEAIRALRVRGAPAIGVAAAWGVSLGLQEPGIDVRRRLPEVLDYLATSRPTAVNLFWALDRLRHAATELGSEANNTAIRECVWQEARAIQEEDRGFCAAIGRHGAQLLQDGDSVLTHCNTGGLAATGYGTALAAFFTAQDQGKRLHVFVDETRPLLQGARLTAWELSRRQIPATLICDSMAAQVMREGRVQAIFVGADRIAANGDTANKIGTYGLAVLAQAHQIPFYVAAPTSTFDSSLADGDGIPIEQRSADEVTHFAGVAAAPQGISVYNPAFDVTPARLIRGIVTEIGVIAPVTTEEIGKTLRSLPPQLTRNRHR